MTFALAKERLCANDHKGGWENCTEGYKRIALCRREEDKFARLKPGRPHTHPYPSVVLEAVAERFALTNMLAILAGDE